MDTFLSCDWGTSAFRLRLVNINSFSVAAEEASAEGIASTHETWKAAGADEETRTEFYLNVINKHIRSLEVKLQYCLSGTAIIISGMASSSVGMLPLPYGKLPLATNGSGLVYEHLKQTPVFKHDVLIISGLQANDDVMRGEETQLIGCINNTNIQSNVLYIFPGTHSKHIQVNNREVIDFKTYMTGELFGLLTQKSILSDTVSVDGNIDEPGNSDSFNQGVMKAKENNLLHSLFNVRAAYLLNKKDKQENYFYLSGLLIGNELLNIQQNNYDEVILCSSKSLKSYYEQAAKVLGIHNFVISPTSIEQAVIKGQYFIYKNFAIVNNAFSWDNFKKIPVVGIMRNIPYKYVAGIAEVYCDAGMSTLEITMNSADATVTIKTLIAEFGDRLNIGAGTVCSVDDLEQALEGGAQFIVTPVYQQQVVEACVKYNVPVFCGAYTPTEIYNAWKNGAAMVKVFPATSLGAGYIKDVLSPLNTIKLLPTGGINADNFTDFLAAGAKGVGMGSNLFPGNMIRDNKEGLKQIYGNIINRFKSWSLNKEAV